MDRVGVIGLGRMGLPIARNLMERGQGARGATDHLLDRFGVGDDRQQHVSVRGHVGRRTGHGAAGLRELG